MKTPIVLLILCSVLLSAGAQVALKAGARQTEAEQRTSIANAAPAILSRLVSFGTNLNIVLGLALYALSALVWIFVLSKIDLSVAYPFVGLGFVVTMVAGWLVFGEPLSAARIAGTLLICAGVALVGSSAS